MKVRIYYNGYENHFFVQYRWFFLWRNFKQYVACYDCGYYDTLSFRTEADALAFVEEKRKERQQKRERIAAAKERDKKSGVVFETII